MNCEWKNRRRPIAARFATIAIVAFTIHYSTFTILLAAPATQPIKTRTFTSNQYNFTLDYPADWTVLDKPVNHQVLSMQTQPVGAADKNLGVMGLRIDPDAGPGNDAEILKATSGQMVEFLFNHGAKNMVIKPDELGDIPARRIRFDTDQPTGTITTIYIVAVHQHTTYVFTAAAPADQIAKLTDGIAAILKDFKVND